MFGVDYWSDSDDDDDDDDDDDGNDDEILCMSCQMILTRMHFRMQ